MGRIERVPCRSGRVAGELGGHGLANQQGSGATQSADGRRFGAGKHDLERMQTFLGHLPRGTPVSFEFRHESWFNEETYQLLRDRNIALCHADSEENALPFVSTADWGYLRLRQPSYSPADLAAWLERIADAGWRDSYVFFKHEDEAAGPAMAKDFMAMDG